MLKKRRIICLKGQLLNGIKKVLKKCIRGE